jgi:hypothetical protein
VVRSGTPVRRARNVIVVLLIVYSAIKALLCPKADDACRPALFSKLASQDLWGGLKKYFSLKTKNRGHYARSSSIF